ncbi:unnamed protein product [Phytophthora fragariaefolia]|uniref:Unnamed protein product n=1 Tax=Phytophthora fragariaefolia TaxID=1490495 RepID=A0A9W6XDE7_9STRA|nr:unnamed protein product [Phytophthora fragariaefolia]
MMGLHLSQQASCLYEEIAEMYAEWFKYKLNRKRRSDALRGLMTSISDDLFSAVMNVVDGVSAPDVDTEVYFEPAVPVYPLVNLSWIPGGADWSRATTEADAVEPWRTWCLTDPASHPYNTCFRARNVDFLPFAPTGMKSHVVEPAVVDGLDLTEPRATLERLRMAMESLLPTHFSAQTPRIRMGPDGVSVSCSPRDIDSSMDLLASAAYYRVEPIYTLIRKLELICELFDLLIYPERSMPAVN